MTKRVGRNDPCPCGSGKKYKHCCLEKERHQRVATPVSLGSFRERRRQNALDPVRRARQFAATCDPYHGLTEDQLFRLLVHPLTSPELIRFSDPLDIEPVAPVMTLFGFLVEALGEKGVKATATGNLPRQVCREAAQMYWGDFLYEQRTQLKGIYQEKDFFDLHFVHVLADIAGLIRRYRGRLILSRECRRRLSESELAGVYTPLFLAGATEYNWAYPWGQELPSIQHAVFFSLYLLALYGDRPLSNVFYEDWYLHYCPLEQHGEIETNFQGPEETLRSTYAERTFYEFAAPFGLVRLQPYIEDKSTRRHFEILKTSQLDHLVRFRSGA